MATTSLAIAGASLLVAALALVIAFRSDRRSARAFKIAEEDRKATPSLGLAFRPSNHTLDHHGRIVTAGTITYVDLAIEVTNSGKKTAGATQVDAWVPSVVDSTTLRWHDASGRELTARSAPDPAVKLPTGDGRTFGAQRISQTLEAVPLMGAALVLRVACPLSVGGDGEVPVRVAVRTDGSRAEGTFPIRLIHRPG